MIEAATFEEATVEKLTAADAVMAIGIGDPNAPPVLFGRAKIRSAAQNRAIAAETTVLRVKVSNEEEFAELKDRVKQAKGELD